MSLIPRVLIGKYNDGVTFGLRCSLPGINAVTDSSAGGDFSFDSSWTDISKIHQVGLGTFPSSDTQESVFFSSLGYAPFFEIRRYVSNVVYDDYWNSTNQWGADAFVFSNTELRINNAGGPAVTFMYIVYRISVPSG